jgi:HPt (histidine-containing phosphotransfer) domain-containing protein
MNLKECYTSFGGDYEDVTKRLMTEKLVSKFLIRFLDDESYHSLLNALEADDQELAFRSAHTLKGICQNLSLTKLGESSSELTEFLRGGSQGDCTELVECVKADYEQTVAAIQQFQAENA